MDIDMATLRALVTDRGLSFNTVVASIAFSAVYAIIANIDAGP